MRIYLAAGKTALVNKRNVAFHYFDARAKKVGVPMTKGILVFDNFSSDDEDNDEYMFRTAFFTCHDEDGKTYILPRQIDFEYDIEQYRDLFKDEYVDFLIKWFEAQRKMNENFTYYCDDPYDMFENVCERENALTEEFKAGYAGSMMRVLVVVTK